MVKEIKMKILNKDLRRRILEKGYEEKLGHLGSALSCVDCIQYLYANVLKEEDVFILSKGHGAMALYAVLEQQGKKPEWKMHPDYDEANGISATTGSLGHGLPIAVGRAFAKQQKGKGNVYVMVGDGEMQEGSNWEALELAKVLKLENLVVLIDWNKYQAVSPLTETTYGGYDLMKAKFQAFGFNTVKIDGHDEKQLSTLSNLEDRLNVVILDTIKGKGVESLEDNHAHVWLQNSIEYKASLNRLK